MISFTQWQRMALAMLAILGVITYAVLAAIVPASATAAGVFVLAVEGGVFLMLQVSRNRRQ